MQQLPLIDLGGIWHIAIFAGIACAVVKWTSIWREFIPLSARLLCCYVLLQALFILEWPAMHFGPYTPEYQATAGQVFVEVLFIPYMAMAFFRYTTRVIPYLAAFACLCTWMNWGGLLHAPSFNSAFAAAAIPFLNPWLVVGVFVTVMFHHGSTAVMIIWAQLLARVIRHRTAEGWMVFMVGTIGMYVIASEHSGLLFDGLERISKWNQFMCFWVREWRWILVGVGPGSFIWTSLMLDNFKPHSLFMQMHSDWLQILWELGVVGLGLSIWVFVDAVKRAWGSTDELAALFGVAAFGLTYYPLRFMTPALLTAYIFVRAFSCKSD